MSDLTDDEYRLRLGYKKMDQENHHFQLKKIKKRILKRRKPLDLCKI